MSQHFAHDLPFGAQPRDDGTTMFRLWAPDGRAIALEIEGRRPIAMDMQPGGWAIAHASAEPGTRYKFRINSDLAVPDPASRLQAGDVHDPSVVVDPRAYAWKNAAWQGRPWHEAVIQELHPGAMGGFRGIMERLADLKELGIT